MNMNKECLMISLAIWIQYTSVRGGQTDRQTDGHQTTASTAVLTHRIVR